MIIKKLNVISFGKFKNKIIEFEPNFNVIYGENEAGKSTLQGFIKCMLYGMNSQKKSIKDNDRKRFLPWSGEKAQGEITFEDVSGREYILKRSFGTTKKEDQEEIIDAITGERVNFINLKEPGKDLLGIGVEGFEKTLMIKQLGALVARGKEDEIIAKLINLNQSGDENVSYEKAINILEEGKKQIITPRKNGKLDLKRVELEALNIEYKEMLKLSEENLEDNIKQNSLEKDIKKLREDIEKLQLYKRHIKRLKLNKEYKEILEYLRKSDELNKQKETVEKGLLSSEGIIDEGFIDNLKQEYSAYKQILNMYDERNTENLDIEVDIESKRDELKDYESFFNLDEDVDRKVVALEAERKSLSSRLKDVEECETSLKALEEEFKYIKEKLEPLSAIDNFRSKIDLTLYDYEEKLKELKFKVEKDPIREDTLEKEKAIGKGYKIANLTMGIYCFVGISTTILYFLKLLKINNLYFYAAGIIAMAGALFSYKKRKAYKCTLKAIRNEKDKAKEIMELHQKVATIEQKLLEYYSMVGAKDYKGFMLKLKEYDENKVELDKLKIKIEERLIQKENYGEETLLENLNRINKFIDFILNHSHSDSIEEFLKKHKTYRDICSDIDTLNIEKEASLNSQKHLKEEIKLKESIIIERLSKVNKRYIPAENIGEEIERLYDKLRGKKELETQISSIESNYKVLLKDRDLDLMREEIGDMLNENIEEDFKDEEALEEALKSKHNELINGEKLLKDVQNSINNRFLGRRRLQVIEENIKGVKEEIIRLQEEAEVINVAYDNLKQCFKELQKDFGPLLNEKVSSIFSYLTYEKYQEVKVSESYTIKARDNFENAIVDVEFLSNGTYDQIYLSLRLALMELIYDKTIKVPLILDDAFTQYDDERLKRVLNYLKTISIYRQIIMFTCQKREVEMLKDRVNIKYLI